MELQAVKPLKTVFERREKKYLLSSEQYDALMARIAPRLEWDDYGKYTICNIYFDTADDLLVRRSLEKPVYKEKLRLRSYGTPHPEDTVYLEIKRKLDGVVYKRRMAMTLDEVREYLSGNAPPHMQGQIFHEIDYLYRKNHLTPRLYLAYDRTAFREKDGELRITFDTAVRARRDRLHLTDGDDGELLLPPGARLMEIKAPLALPLWLTHILAGEQIYSTSFSKYGRRYQIEQEDRICLPASSRQLA